MKCHIFCRERTLNSVAYWDHSSMQWADINDGQLLNGVVPAYFYHTEVIHGIEKCQQNMF
jgi:hypothetical protein